MLARAKAQDIEEDLASVEASVADLISVEEVEDMAGAKRTWDFGPSLMTEEMILELEREGYVDQGKAKLPQGETIPKPQAGEGGL